jgi:endonuclease/exonuclease/phosphatase family metal-dependent hydrolase
MRVVTWNIGPGPFPDRWWRRIDADRLRAIGVFLAGLDADIIALQEVAVLSRDGELVDTAGDLGRQLGMEARFAAVRTFDVVAADAVTGTGLFGNAILSRLSIRSTRCVALPRAPEEAVIEPAGTRHMLTGEPHAAAGITYADAPADIREPRCLLLVDVDRLRVGCTHFSHIGSGERQLQAEATAAAFGGASAALLLGDLNAAIEAPELRSFTGWSDGFAEPPGDPARVSTDDGWRIDHVLGRGVRMSTAARVLRDAGSLSDHYPVAAEIELA